MTTTIDWWCPKCEIRIEVGEAAWQGWNGVEAVCYDCGTLLDVRDFAVAEGAP